MFAHFHHLRALWVLTFVVWIAWERQWRQGQTIPSWLLESLSRVIYGMHLLSLVSDSLVFWHACLYCGWIISPYNE
jgi:hypothetical protein